MFLIIILRKEFLFIIINLENKYLESINVILGFNGNPVIPYRINVYSINKEGVPDNLLNRKMVEVFPSKKMKNYKIDFKDQKIKLPENGFCVSIELLNNSIKHKKLGKYYSPIVGFDKKYKNNKN